MHRLVEEANSTHHNGQSYIIRVTKIGKLITCNMRYIHKTLLTTEQYLQVKRDWTCGRYIYGYELS